MTLCSLNGMQTIATVETMNFRILSFIIRQPPFGLVKSRQNHSLYTISKNKRWSPPPPPPTITLMEWMKFKDFSESCSLHAESRVHKISSTLSKVVMGGGGGGRHSTSAFYSVKLCVKINFSLRQTIRVY